MNLHFIKLALIHFQFFLRKQNERKRFSPSPHLTTWMKNGGLKGLMFLQAL